MCTFTHLTSTLFGRLTCLRFSEDNYQVVDYCSRISVESHMIEEQDIPKWLGPSGAPKDCHNLFLMALLDNHEQKHVEFIFACSSP